MTDKSKELLKNYALEIAQSLVKIDLEKLKIKEVKESAKESELDVKALTKLANTYHKNSFFDEQQEWNEFASLYSEVFPEEV